MKSDAVLQARERTERLILAALLSGPLDFHRIAKLALPNVSFREVDARVRMLRTRGEVETRVPAGQRKARWHITERGSFRIRNPPRTDYDTDPPIDHHDQATLP